MDLSQLLKKVLDISLPKPSAARILISKFLKISELRKGALKFFKKSISLYFILNMLQILQLEFCHKTKETTILQQVQYRSDLLLLQMSGSCSFSNFLFRLSLSTTYIS